MAPTLDVPVLLNFKIKLPFFVQGERVLSIHLGCSQQ